MSSGFASPESSCSSSSSKLRIWTSAPNSRAIIVAVSVSSVWLIVIISRFISSLARTSFDADVELVREILHGHALGERDRARDRRRRRRQRCAHGRSRRTSRLCPLAGRWPRTAAAYGGRGGMPGPLRIHARPRRHAGLLRRTGCDGSGRGPPTGICGGRGPAGRGGIGAAARTRGLAERSAAPDAAGAAGRAPAARGVFGFGASRGATRGRRRASAAAPSASSVAVLRCGDEASAARCGPAPAACGGGGGGCRRFDAARALRRPVRAPERGGSTTGSGPAAAGARQRRDRFGRRTGSATAAAARRPAPGRFDAAQAPAPVRLGRQRVVGRV